MVSPQPCYQDPRIGRTYDFAQLRWRSGEGHPLMITPLPGVSRQEIDSRERSLWRYRP